MPEVVGLLLGGVIVGPHVLGFFGPQHPLADFLAEVGALGPVLTEHFAPRLVSRRLASENPREQPPLPEYAEPAQSRCGSDSGEEAR
nr:hypothetical protein [uncultured Rhodopila sp.]